MIVEGSVARFAILGLIGFGMFVYISNTPSRIASGTVTQTCSATAPNSATALLSWKRAPAQTVEIWLDVSIGKSFAAGASRGYGPLAPAQTQYTLDALPSGLRLWYRVNTRTAEGWKIIAEGSLVATCGPPLPAPTARPTPAVDVIGTLRDRASGAVRSAVEDAVRDQISDAAPQPAP